MPAHCEVKGARQMRAAMKKAGEDMSDMKALHADIAKLVATAANPPIKTGALQKSIRPAGQAARAIVRAGGARVPYAGAVEWGWPRHGIRPRHYLTDAAHSTEPRWFDMYITAVQAILDRVKGL